MIQNTIGYATPLNRFQRPDVQPAVEEEELPVFPDWGAAGEAGYSPSWDQLPPDRQSTQAERQESKLAADLAWVRENLQDSGAKEEPNR